MKNNTLKKKADIDRVMKRGRNTHDRYCGFRFISNEGMGVRSVFLIGVKLDKRAVVRNRLRRQYREIVEALLEDTDPDIDIILFPKKEALNVSYEVRKAQLQKLFKANRIIAS